MAPKLTYPGINLEGVTKALCAFLPEVSPSQHRNAKVSLGLKDAEAIGGMQ